MKQINHRDVPSFYHIDEYGNILNTKRNKYRKAHHDKDGYLNIVLYNNEGERQNFKVHQLVALTYIGDPPEGMTMVNHKDGIRDNNNVSNLEWVNDALNKLHSKTEGAYYKKKKDTYKLVDRICALLEKGYDTPMIMDELGIYGAKKNPQYPRIVKLISAIRNRRYFTHIIDKYNIEEGSTTNEPTMIFKVRYGRSRVGLK